MIQAITDHYVVGQMAREVWQMVCKELTLEMEVFVSPGVGTVAETNA